MKRGKTFCLKASIKHAIIVAERLVFMARILVIEDNSDIQEILRTLLTRRSMGYQAFSGTKGIMLLTKMGIDLVLLDIMLPGKNGDQVLKLSGKQSQIPVIMLTALSDKKLISQYLLEGANDYIVKPFDLDEVFARVTVQLRQSEKNSLWSEKTENLPQSLKNIQFDAESFEIKNSQGPFALPRKNA